MTPNELIESVKGNIGNRDKGKIGNTTVDTAILNGINIGLPHLVQECQPDYYNRTATIPIVLGTQAYDLPTVDDDGGIIRIKDIYASRGFRSDGTTPHTFIHLNYSQFVEKVRYLESGVTGSPCYFALWGKSNKLHLDYVPDEAYSLVMFIKSYPINLTSSDLNTALPINEEWNLVLESFVTSYCYLKLQQAEMYAIWNDLYQKQKDSVSRDVQEKQGHNLQVTHITRMISDPLLDPFVRNYNVQ